MNSRQFRSYFCLALLIALSFDSQAQLIYDFGKHQPPAEFKNTHAEKLYTDSLGTAFLIWVKNSVKMHHHAHHTEYVQVIEGEGLMQLGEELRNIRPGDFIIIPGGVKHSVTVQSKEPMKVLSIQTPEFFGKDRVFEKQ